jgi:hypothetical protein
MTRSFGYAAQSSRSQSSILQDPKRPNDKPFNVFDSYSVIASLSNTAGVGDCRLHRSRAKGAENCAIERASQSLEPLGMDTDKLKSPESFKSYKARVFDVEKDLSH